MAHLRHARLRTAFTVLRCEPDTKRRSGGLAAARRRQLARARDARSLFSCTGSSAR